MGGFHSKQPGEKNSTRQRDPQNHSIHTSLLVIHTQNLTEDLNVGNIKGLSIYIYNNYI